MKINKRSVMHGTPIYITAVICCILILAGCAAPPAEPVAKRASAKFEVTSLAVTPIVASPGQAVTVEVEVRNVGRTEGSNTLTLTVNGVEEEVKDVTVAPGATETVAFTLVRDASGMYDIEVAGLTETLRVKQAGAFPRLGKFYAGPNAFFWRLQQFNSDQINSLLKSLARWDLIVVNYDVARSSPEYIRQIKMLNPQAKILAYIEAGTGGWWHWLLTDDSKTNIDPKLAMLVTFLRLHAQYFGITVQDSDESFFLHYGVTPGNNKPPEQRRVILWTNSTTGEEWPGMNPASDWATYLPNFVNDKVMSSGLFDGVFYDCVWEAVAWQNNIDIDNDGVADSPGVINRECEKGMARLLKLTRELLGPGAIIFGNPGLEWSTNSPYFEYANGHMQENALGTESWSSHDFSKVWEIYQRNMQKPTPPSRIHMIAVDTNNVQYDPFNPKLPAADLQKMRYGLAITSLDDGYFNFDIGDDFHSELWWFPEYDANLGLAKGDAQKRIDGSWMREFENGVVVANPTNSKCRMEFTNSHKDVTTGINGLQFEVPSRDGRIFVVTD